MTFRTFGAAWTILAWNLLAVIMLMPRCGPHVLRVRNVSELPQRAARCRVQLCHRQVASALSRAMDRAGNNSRLDSALLVTMSLSALHLKWRNIDRKIASGGQNLCWDHMVHSRDATHLACAIVLKCGLIETTDEGLVKLDGKISETSLRICRHGTYIHPIFLVWRHEGTGVQGAHGSCPAMLT